MIKKVIKGISFAAGLLFAIQGFSQDSSGKSIDIRTAFKPVLKESAKINFNPSPAPNDTSRPVLNYSIPNQNLLFSYQPGTLKPLALQVDSGGHFNIDNYIKVGFGSLKTPFVQAGFSFGDGKTAGLNIMARHISSSGKREYQNYSNTSFGLKGFLQTAKNLEWNAGLGTKQDRYNKYGYLPETLVFPKDSVKQSFQTIGANIGFHNINLTEFGLSYSPKINIDVFSDNKKNSESNTVVDIPLQKTVGSNFTVNLGLNFNLTRYKPNGKTAINNTFYYLAPGVVYKSSNILINGGIKPSWDNKTFKLFPNVMAEVSTDDNQFTVQAGWIGYLRKNSYQSLEGVNPWLNAPDSLRNTWVEERYVGLKGTLGDHFNYSAKVGFNKLNNQALFVNDLNDGKSFDAVFEKQMKVFHFGAEVGYTVQEKFSAMAGVKVNQYTNLKTYDKAYGLPPVEINAAFRMQIIKDLWLKGDLFMWDGITYRKSNLTWGRLNRAADLSAGLEFRITKNLNLWAQFNNLFNNEYQRWNQYPVYGFNFVGGIVFSFAQ